MVTHWQRTPLLRQRLNLANPHDAATDDDDANTTLTLDGRIAQTVPITPCGDEEGITVIINLRDAAGIVEQCAARFAHQRVGRVEERADGAGRH